MIIVVLLFTDNGLLRDKGLPNIRLFGTLSWDNDVSMISRNNEKGTRVGVSPCSCFLGGKVASLQVFSKEVRPLFG